MGRGSELSRSERQLLRLLRRQPGDFWQLAAQQEADLKQLIENLERLRRKKLLSQADGKFRLTRKGAALAAELRLEPIDLACADCEGTGLALRGRFVRLLREFSRLARGRPLPAGEFDQGFMRPIDSVRRAAFMHSRSDLEARSIILIGDDDLVSLALALTGLPKRIVVLDLDERLLEFIAERADENGFPIEAIKYDVRERLPAKLRGAFDVFLTDPVETLPGIKLYLARGAASLRPNGSAYFGLTRLEASLEKWQAIESMLIRMKFAITDIIRDFSIYPEKENQRHRFYSSYRLAGATRFKLPLPACDWYRSSFIRAEALGRPVPLVKGRARIGKRFYLDDETLATPQR